MKFGAPPAPVLSPFLFRMDTCWNTPASATRTPSTAWTFGSSDSSIGGGVWSLPKPAGFAPVTETWTAPLPGWEKAEDALARGLEDVGERLFDRVREDVGARDHRDAEHDGERRQGRAKLACAQAPE